MEEHCGALIFALMFAGERFLSFFLFLCFSRPRSLSSQPSSAAELTSNRSSARTSQSKVRRALIRRDPICALLDLCAAEKRLRRSELASCRLLHTSLGQLGPIKRAPSKLLSGRPRGVAHKTTRERGMARHLSGLFASPNFHSSFGPIEVREAGQRDARETS